jgi:hypothetical protein
VCSAGPVNAFLLLLEYVTIALFFFCDYHAIKCMTCGSRKKQTRKRKLYAIITNNLIVKVPLSGFSGFWFCMKNLKVASIIFLGCNHSQENVKPKTWRPCWYHKQKKLIMRNLLLTSTNMAAMTSYATEELLIDY